jgi:high-affinity K+ transport system ATPase subunit B
MLRYTYIACIFIITITMIVTISSAVNTETFHTVTTVIVVIIYIIIAVIVLTIVYATFQFMYESERPNVHNQLLKEIQSGVKLKKVQTNDRSRPQLDGKCCSPLLRELVSCKTRTTVKICPASKTARLK